MTLEEKLRAFKEKGWTYNKDTGEVFSHTGKPMKGKGYISCCIRIDGRYVRVKAHQLAYYIITGDAPVVIDHINQIKNDNRFINLRSVTYQQNRFNVSAKGYYWHTVKQQFVAYIGLNQKLNYLGSYDSEEEARKAYLNAKQKCHII